MVFLSLTYNHNEAAEVLVFQYPIKTGDAALVCAPLSQRLYYCVEKGDEGKLHIGCDYLNID